jgi:hypothetical protein
MTPTSQRNVATLALIAAPAMLVFGGSSLAGCGGGEGPDYKPKPAYSGKAAALPPVPTLPKKPKKNGDAYTVWGAIHDLHSRVNSPKLLAQETITLVGYIVKTNLDQAPPCAVHKTGKADGKECEKNPPAVPQFWIADEKTSPLSEAIPVLGWASNYAKIFDAIEKYKKKDNKDPAKDDAWGAIIPNPLPAKDAKVKVVGKYATTFTLASTGVEANPLTGILTFKTMEYLEPPPVPGTLPGMK